MTQRFSISLEGSSYRELPCKLKLGTLIGVSGEKLEIIHKKLIVINDPVH